jgi:hypothetical protein
MAVRAKTTIFPHCRAEPRPSPVPPIRREGSSLDVCCGVLIEAGWLTDKQFT